MRPRNHKYKENKAYFSLIFRHKHFENRNTNIKDMWKSNVNNKRVGLPWKLYTLICSIIIVMLPRIRRIALIAGE